MSYNLLASYRELAKPYGLPVKVYAAMGEVPEQLVVPIKQLAKVLLSRHECELKAKLAAAKTTGSLKAVALMALHVLYSICQKSCARTVGLLRVPDRTTVLQQHVQAALDKLEPFASLSPRLVPSLSVPSPRLALAAPPPPPCMLQFDLEAMAVRSSRPPPSPLPHGSSQFSLLLCS